MQDTYFKIDNDRHIVYGVTTLGMEQECLTIPEGVESIDNYTFCDCALLEEIVFPKSLKAIRSNAFLDCSSLRKVTFLGDVETIGPYAFGHCKMPSEIVLPPGYSMIGGNPFEECMSVCSVVSPACAQDNRRKVCIRIEFVHNYATVNKCYTMEVCDSVYRWLEKHAYIDDIVNFYSLESVYDIANQGDGIDSLYNTLKKMREDCARELGYSVSDIVCDTVICLRQPYIPGLYGPKMLAKKMEGVRQGDKDVILGMLDYYAGKVYDMEKAKSMVLLYTGMDMSYGQGSDCYEVYENLSRYMLHIRQFDEETRMLIAERFTQILAQQETIDPEVVSEYLDLYKTLGCDDNDLVRLLKERVGDMDRNAMEALGLISHETTFYEEEFEDEHGGKIPAAVYLAEIFNRCFDDGKILVYLKNYFYYGIGVQRDERILQYIQRCIERKAYTDGEIEKRQRLFENLQFGIQVNECEYDLSDIDIDDIWSYQEEDFVESLGELDYYSMMNGDSASLLIMFKADAKEFSYFLEVVQTWRDNDGLSSLWDTVMRRLCMEIVEEDIEAEYALPVYSIIDKDDYLKGMFLEVKDENEDENEN